MNINVSIERLVLDGLPMSRSQGMLVQEAVERELTRLLTIEGLAASASRAEPYLRAGYIDVIPNSGARSLGRQIGLAVHNALNHSEQPTPPNQNANTP
jgi:hypothetical protein